MAVYTRLTPGWGPKNGAILATVAHQQTAPRSTLYVAATHFHPEHMMQLGPAHTRGDLGFFVEGDNVVFTGNVAMSRPLGINADSAYSSDEVEARARGPVSPSAGRWFHD